MAAGGLLVVSMLLIASARETVGDALICNSQTTLGLDLVRQVYGKYAVQLPYECTDDGMRQEEIQFGAEGAACTVMLESVVALVAGIACWAEIKQKHDAHLSRCGDLQRKMADQAALLNARVPLEDAPFLAQSSSDLYVDYVLNVDTSLGTYSAPDGKVMVWTAIGFATTPRIFSGCVGPTSLGDCATAWLFVPPVSQLGGVALGITKTSFTQPGGKTLAPDLTLDPTLQEAAATPNGPLVRTVDAGSSSMAWGIRVPGCAPPNITLRVQWTFQSEVVQGQSITGPYLQDSSGATPKVACWARTMTVIGVASVPMWSARAMLCDMPMSMNQIRSLLAQMPRTDVAAKLQQAAWAVPRSKTLPSMVYSASQVNALMECAQPSDGGIGKSWQGMQPGAFGTSPTDAGMQGTPGACVPCTASGSTDAASLRMQNRQIRACNRSLDAERLLDCCTECRPGFMAMDGKGCVVRCRPGTAANALTGRCEACATGTYSLGGYGVCVTCDLLGVLNAYVDARQGGCIGCGWTAQAMATTANGVGYCKPCGPGLFVQEGLAECQGCGRHEAYYLPAGGSACVGCPPGTYMDPQFATACQTCPPNQWTSTSGRTACLDCASGYRHSTNHTACLPCAPINRTLFPFAQYFEPGCRVRCQPNASYTRTSALMPGGCGNCSTIAIPTGRYIAQGAPCTTTLACTNGPIGRNFTYTGPSTRMGVSLCPYACNVGYTGEQCLPCGNLSRFNASVHRLMYGCAYTCRPYLFVDAGLLCDTPCANLLSDFQSGRALAMRVRDTTTVNRPYYIHNVCGSSQGVPTSPIAALQRGLWAFNAPAAWVSARYGSRAPSVFCGDAFLNMGEACDDGNAMSGDGCSEMCTVETDRYWDCDLIGAPCLSDCGWKSLSGYVLPTCGGGRCTCAGLLYYDVQSLSTAAARIAWIRDHLVACDCGGNTHRMLPYANCTASNGGCRQCAPGQYHDDLRSVCVSCGSACAVGYTSAATKACGPSVSTSDLLGSNRSLEEAQSSIGCAPCAPPANGILGVRYLGNGTCAYACARSPLGIQVSDDTYCQTLLDASGACTSACMRCSVALNLIDDVVVAPGFYPQGCMDGAGYQWAPCEGLPSNAVWTTSTRVANDARGCAWQCGVCAVPQNGACVACGLSSSVVCVPGQIKVACAGCGNGYVACVPCTDPLPNALQAWTSESPFDRCIADCEPGISFSPQRGGTCTACTRMECGMGQKFVPCSVRADASCMECESTALSLPANAEYVGAGDCISRCASGFYQAQDQGRCMPCVPIVACVPGELASSMCADPSERLAPPKCMACPLALAEGMMWAPGAACEPVCKPGLIPHPGASMCVPCDAALCGMGRGGECSAGGLQCTPCASLPEGAGFALAGDCGATVCLAGYRFSPLTYACVPVDITTTTPIPMASHAPSAGGRPLVGLSYPVRGIRHS